jgi:glycerophosphoryl diester phosphodiesterase
MKHKARQARAVWSEARALLAAAAARGRGPLRSVIVAGASAELFTAQVLLPLGVLAVNWLVRATGDYAVANTDLARFFTSWQGLSAVFIASVVALVGQALARGAMIVAIRRAESRPDASGIAAFVSVLMHARTVVGIVLRQTAVCAALALPFVAAAGAVAHFALRGVDLYWFVTAQPSQFWIALACVVVLVGSGASLVILRLMSWTLAYPLGVITGKSPGDALRESDAAMRGKRLAVGAARGVWLGAVSLVAGALAVCLRIAAELVLRAAGSDLHVGAALAGVVVIVFGVVGFVMVMTARVGDALIVDAAWRTYARESSGMTSGVGASLGAGPLISRRRRRIVVLGALATSCAFGIVGTRSQLEAARQPITIEITAHRGAEMIAPENTVAAIMAAVEMGVDRIEIDVMLTADDAPVIFHDTDLRRIAGDARRISSLSLDEVRRIDAGSWFAAAFAGERIPTLDEALHAAKGSRLNLELKAVAGKEDVLAQRVAAALREHETGAAKDVLVTSLGEQVLIDMQRHRPGVRVGRIVSAAVGNIRRSAVTVLAIESRLATREFIQRTTAAGMELHVWGVDTPEAFTTMALAGVEGVITKDPAAMMKRRAELNELEEAQRLLLAVREELVGGGRSWIVKRMLGP